MIQAITRTHFLSVLLLLLSSVAVFAVDTDEWIVHVTPEGAPYKTEIVIANSARNDSKVVFQHPISSELYTVTVAGGETLVISPRDFPFYPMASLHIHSRGASVQVSSRYSSDELEVPLTVPATAETANVFRFNNPSPRGDWQGVAMINLGEEVSTVRVIQYNDNQQIIYQEDLSDLLAPNSKYLNLLSALPFDENPNSYFEIHTSQPASALVLTGGATVSGKSYLTANRSTASFKNMVRVSRTGGFANSEYTVRIEGGVLCRLNAFVNNRTEDCVKLTNSELDQLVAEITDKTVLDLEVSLTTPPTVGCADQFFYEVEVNWDGKSNTFTYDECDIEFRANGEVARSFVNAIFALGEEVIEGSPQQ